MDRRSFIATLLAAPLALIGWKRKPKPTDPGTVFNVGPGAGDIKVWDAGKRLAEGQDFEVIGETGCIRIFREPNRDQKKILKTFYSGVGGKSGIIWP